MKTTKTFSIEEDIYEKFEDICKFKGMNKSNIIQKSIKQFIVDNYEIDKNINYRIKGDKNDDILQIINKEDNYIILSNGNKIDIYTFEKIYERANIDVENVLKQINKNINHDADVDVIDPDFLNKPSINIQNAKNIIENIDIKKNLESEAKGELKTKITINEDSIIDDEDNLFTYDFLSKSDTKTINEHNKKKEQEILNEVIYNSLLTENNKMTGPDNSITDTIIENVIVIPENIITYNTKKKIKHLKNNLTNRCNGPISIIEDGNILTEQCLLVIKVPGEMKPNEIEIRELVRKHGLAHNLQFIYN